MLGSVPGLDAVVSGQPRAQPTGRRKPSRHKWKERESSFRIAGSAVKHRLLGSHLRTALEGTQGALSEEGLLGWGAGAEGEGQ